MSPTTTEKMARPVGEVLAIVHDDWMKAVTSSLAPAADIRSDFWSRWGAVRFLADEFGDRFRLESGFARTLERVLSPADVDRLEAIRHRVERSRAELMEVGRLPESAAATAGLAQRLLDDIACWCAELEQVTRLLLPAQLTAEARGMLARLRVAHAFGR
jgi:hypothetical protein